MPSVVATIKVKADKIEEATAFFQELSSDCLKNEAGTTAYTVHQRVDDPTVFIFYEKYVDEEAFAIHGKNLRAHGAKFVGVLDGAPEIVMLQEV
ncbi:MAG: hypothetical protein GY725_02410 [bacterium]|nr:hypothetical protein [bacterium]